MFQIINSREKWKSITQLFDSLDVYFDYDYAKLFANIEKGALYGAFYYCDYGKVFYPFIIRSIDISSIKDQYDIVTPYGYGGPHLEGKSVIINDFYKEFAKFCRANSIVTETIRFHPLLKNHKNCMNIMDVDYIRKTTATNLEQSLEVIRGNYGSMNKRNIKKAKKNNLIAFEATKSDENINIFIDIYNETMDRNEASDYYYFSKNYFKEQLKDTDIFKSKLLFVEYNDTVIAGVLVLLGKSYAHYHLGGSLTDYLSMKPNNLLYDYMIEIAKDAGCQLLHLGGGYQEDDGLFKYKSSFTNQNNYNYYIGKKVYDFETYTKINSYIEKKYEINENFFPKYRGIVTEK